MNNALKSFRTAIAAVATAALLGAPAARAQMKPHANAPAAPDPVTAAQDAYGLFHNLCLLARANRVPPATVARDNGLVEMPAAKARAFLPDRRTGKAYYARSDSGEFILADTGRTCAVYARKADLATVEGLFNDGLPPEGPQRKRVKNEVVPRPGGGTLHTQVFKLFRPDGKAGGFAALTTTAYAAADVQAALTLSVE